MILPYTPTAVVFDMDGLLFDTEALYQRAILAAARDGGYDISPVIHLMIGRPWHQSELLLAEHYGPSFPVTNFMNSMVSHFDVMAVTDLTVKPGVKELLDTLDELQMPRAIATSSAHSTVQRHLTSHGIVGRFHKIVAHGDYISSKPAPDPFLKAAQELNVSPHLCLALEDSYNGVRSAAAAGMMTIMVPDLHNPTSEIESLCVSIAPDLHQVRHLILESIEQTKR